MKQVTAAIAIQDDRVFLARRAPDQALAGRWEFPGGKMEYGETPEQCLRRELREEFGVDATVMDFVTESIYEYETGAIQLLAYVVQLNEDEVSLRVHDKVAWVPLDELLEYDLLPADVPVAEKLARSMLNRKRGYEQRAF